MVFASVKLRVGCVLKNKFVSVADRILNSIFFNLAHAIFYSCGFRAFLCFLIKPSEFTFVHVWFISYHVFKVFINTANFLSSLL
jgi:hypothetical protein